jgi:hypothetical protein
MQSANVWIPVTTAVMTAVLSGAILLLLQWLVTPRIELNKTIQQEQWKTKRDAFLKAKGISPTVRATYISLLREELFGSTAKIDPDQVPYFLHPPPDQLRTATEAIENSATRQPGQA